ncbi:hypothetical protein OG596_01150 [Streptomyces sp. NBC_01102]|uniref:hypothetical protein n=1 Tax=unclassified Streptomyces TaxID=2593676 RepID=UPI003863CBF2|nr:hypothetical protein OG596_01150 [Streptomyces sp. NBC_01102]
MLARTVPPLSTAAVRPQLDALDERFRQATIPWPGHEEGGGPWWHRRVPRTLVPDVGEPVSDEWPLGWDMMPFPKPPTVRVEWPDGS